VKIALHIDVGSSPEHHTCGVNQKEIGMTARCDCQIALYVRQGSASNPGDDVIQGSGDIFCECNCLTFIYIKCAKTLEQIIAHSATHILRNSDVCAGQGLGKAKICAHAHRTIRDDSAIGLSGVGDSAKQGWQ